MQVLEPKITLTEEDLKKAMPDADAKVACVQIPWIYRYLSSTESVLTDSPVLFFALNTS